ncbi:MAG: glycosyl transferase [Eubacterium sp.]|nr:glycosyl transferase [Eubacterium sp.]
MIPKIIHYCWFGGNEKPKSVLKCINSWKEFCPDYEIIEWNENNFDITQIPYMQQAYDAKKYAFVSDVARLIVVYNCGGLYFDTDVEVVKSFDDLLNLKAFMGFENDENVATGLGIGAEAGLDFFAKHIEEYKNKTFINKDGSLNLIACTKYTTNLLAYYGLKTNGEMQLIDEITILPKDYLNPYDSLTGKLRKTKNTYSIHWYDASWNDKSTQRLKINRLIRRVFGEKTVNNIKSLFGKIL